MDLSRSRYKRGFFCSDAFIVSTTNSCRQDELIRCCRANAGSESPEQEQDLLPCLGNIDQHHQLSLFFDVTVFSRSGVLVENVIAVGYCRRKAIRSKAHDAVMRQSNAIITAICFILISCSSGREIGSLAVLFVGNLLHPLHGYAIELYLYSNVRHCCIWRSTVPVLHPRRNPDDIAFRISSTGLPHC
jgi:hypothetical protein